MTNFLRERKVINHISELQKLLPNFPTDILEQWFLPYVESNGMPWDKEGNAIGRWKYLLQNKPLHYWKNILWDQIEAYIPIDEYCDEWKSVLLNMVEGAVLGKTNVYSISINNLKERFDSVLEYLEAEKVFPKPPILLLEKDKGITVLDGNHRISAFLYSLSQHYRDKKDGKIDTLPMLEQRYWIGINRENK